MFVSCLGVTPGTGLVNTGLKVHKVFNPALGGPP